MVDLPKNKSRNKKRTAEPSHLMTPQEVASKFAVDAKTIRNWENKGKLKAIRTPGGARRYIREDVHNTLKLQGYEI